MTTPDRDNTAPLYPPLTGPLEPGETELYPITEHLASFFASGGSLLGDQDDIEDDDPPPTLGQLRERYGESGPEDFADLARLWREYEADLTQPREVFDHE